MATVTVDNATYSDLYTLTGLTNKPIVALNDDAIRNSVYNIITTPLGTRYRRPEYGCNLMHLIYEPLDTRTESQIKIAIISALQTWEPRIEVLSNLTSVTADMSVQGYRVQITYRIKKYDTISRLTLTVRG